MTNEEKINELKKLSLPVQQFLKENYNLMSKAIITIDFAEIVSGEIGVPNELFANDKNS